MKDKEIISGLVEKLEKDFAVEGNSLPVTDDYNKKIEELRNHLIEKIIEQMEKNLERFLNTLYRIDIDETKLNAVLEIRAVSEVPEKIADLIIERQLQRVKTQILYKQGKL